MSRCLILSHDSDQHAAIDAGSKRLRKSCITGIQEHIDSYRSAAAQVHSHVRAVALRGHPAPTGSLGTFEDGRAVIESYRHGFVVDDTHRQGFTGNVLGAYRLDPDAQRHGLSGVRTPAESTSASASPNMLAAVETRMVLPVSS